MTSPYSITIETKNERGTKEFEEEIFGKMKDIMQSITKDLFKEPIITFHISSSNGNSFVVWRKEKINKQGMFTKHILCYKKTREEAEFSKQRYEIKHKKGLEKQIAPRSNSPSASAEAEDLICVKEENQK